MRRQLALLAACIVLLTGLGLRAQDSSPVQFNRDIRPIFSDTCFKCHGPDSAARKANLRLDTQEGAFTARKGKTPFVPGRLDKSEGYRRIVSSDPEQLMPPPDSHLSLTPAQKELVRRWIEQGAKYQKHWSFIPPVRPTPPSVKDTMWGRNPIDRFVLSSIESQGLGPSTQAPRHTLIRRLYLDLTGLPPSPQELDGALNDPSADWYERLVERLLNTSRYGERMARPWLDASRYADTNGYQVDTSREMWLWREWVIGAFNQNLPYDRFVVEQLAGDLLPNATIEQKIASGFNRNHRINGEGGIIPEEFLAEYIVDRVDATGTVFMGLTLGCARCHDHKFDPVTQKEFYQLYAFFHNVPEQGVDGLFGPSKPFMRVPTPEQKAKLDGIVAQWNELKAKTNQLEPALAKAQAHWEQSRAGLSANLPTEGLAAAFAFERGKATGAGDEVADRRWKFKGGRPSFKPSPFGRGAEFDGQKYIDAGDLGNFERDKPFTLGAWVYSLADSDGAVIARMDETNAARGYNLYISKGQVLVQLISKFPDDALLYSTPAILPPEQWRHVLATYDGSAREGAIKVYVDGEPVAGAYSSARLTGAIATAMPLTIGARLVGARFRGAIDEVRIYDRALSPDEVRSLATDHLTATVLSKPPDQRTPVQTRTLREQFVLRHGPEEYRKAWSQVLGLERERRTLEQTFPSTLVMEELDKPRDTFVLMRGQYDKPGEKVEPDVPASLPRLRAPQPRNRLTLAKWLVSGEHPLTARVAVNRLWQNVFGEGLVRTAEDFGSQGQWPSHPELLDWLATEYVRTGWDTKAMLRLMVTSSTYRQSSAVRKELLERDPDNRLLARGPRFRLPAETIRDQALAVSGLLVEKVGGPSVKPYQPPKLWEELTSGGFSANTYEQDHGPSLYRRGLYTYWKRTIPPPSMAVFDAPSREICVVRRQRTNTPLQALALMNDVIYVEAARRLAQRMMHEGGSEPTARLGYGFRLVTARAPASDEMVVLSAAFQRHLSEFRALPSEAEKLLSVGESPRDKSLDPAEHAAYTAVANLILNLDEAITRE